MVENKTRQRLAIEISKYVIASGRQVAKREEDGRRIGELPEVQFVVRRAPCEADGESRRVGVEIKFVNALERIALTEKSKEIRPGEPLQKIQALGRRVVF